MNKMDKQYKIIINFVLTALGDWQEPVKSAEALVTVAIKSLKGEERPDDYTIEHCFKLIFIRNFPDRVAALSFAKKTENSVVACWADEKNRQGELKNAKADPDGVDVEEIVTSPTE